MYTWATPMEKQVIQRGGLELQLKYHLQLKTKEERCGRGGRGR